MRILHENPELYGAKRRFLPFLCIAERVTVRGATLFRRAVNSNTLRDAQKLQKMQFRAVKLGIFVQNTHENTSRNGP